MTVVFNYYYYVQYTYSDDEEINTFLIKSHKIWAYVGLNVKIMGKIAKTALFWQLIKRWGWSISLLQVNKEIIYFNNFLCILKLVQN